jgi:hypothetical protein
MGGGGNQAQQSSSALANTEANIAQQYLNMSQGQLAYGQQLEQPLVNFYQGIASGNQNNLMTAAAPEIANITGQSRAAQANIWNTVPAGAGRDFALAQAQQNQAGQTASTLNQTYNQALTGLAQLGTAQQGVGLQEAGAGIGGISGAQSAYGNIMQTQAQAKSSALGFLGSIFGAAGSAAGGFDLGGGGGGGSVAAPTYTGPGSVFGTTATQAPGWGLS